MGLSHYAQSLALGSLAAWPWRPRAIHAAAHHHARAAMALVPAFCRRGSSLSGYLQVISRTERCSSLTVLRYVERNALRANLVVRAEAWRWSSLWRSLHPKEEDETPVLSDWPVDRPRNWVWRVNQPERKDELDALRQSGRRGRPFGTELWQHRISKRLGLESTFRPRGRPRNKP